MEVWHESITAFASATRTNRNQTTRTSRRGMNSTQSVSSPCKAPTLKATPEVSIEIDAARLLLCTGPCEGFARSEVGVGTLGVKGLKSVVFALASLNDAQGVLEMPEETRSHTFCFLMRKTTLCPVLLLALARAWKRERTRCCMCAHVRQDPQPSTGDPTHGAVLSGFISQRFI